MLNKALYNFLQEKEKAFKMNNKKGFAELESLIKEKGPLSTENASVLQPYEILFRENINNPHYDKENNTLVFAKFVPSEWRIYISDLKKGVSYTLADVIRAQYLLAASKTLTEYVMPSQIVIVITLADYEELKLFTNREKMFCTTKVGKKISLILKEFNLKIKHGHNIISSFKPNTSTINFNYHPVGTLTILTEPEKQVTI